MPPLERMDRKQTALYWEWRGKDRYGHPVVSPDPVELRVRWINRQQEVLDRQGNTMAVDGTVILGQAVVVGSILWLGSLDDLPGTGTAAPDSGLVQVITYDETSDIKNRFVRREATFMRFTDSLPRG